LPTASIASTAKNGTTIQRYVIATSLCRPSTGLRLCASHSSRLSGVRLLRAFAQSGVRGVPRQGVAAGDRQAGACGSTPPVRTAIAVHGFRLPPPLYPHLPVSGERAVSPLPRIITAGLLPCQRGRPSV